LSDYPPLEPLPTLGAITTNTPSLAPAAARAHDAARGGRSVLDASLLAVAFGARAPTAGPGENISFAYHLPSHALVPAGRLTFIFEVRPPTSCQAEGRSVWGGRGASTLVLLALPCPAGVAPDRMLVSTELKAHLAPPANAARPRGAGQSAPHTDAGVRRRFWPPPRGPSTRSRRCGTISRSAWPPRRSNRIRSTRASVIPPRPRPSSLKRGAHAQPARRE
jgi:hypothetical protein